MVEPRPSSIGRCSRRQRPPALARRAIVLLTASFIAAPLLLRASELRRTAIVQAVERVKSSVVNIHGEKRLRDGEAAPGPIDPDRRVNGMGTGAIIDHRGYIITNHHVVDGVEQINVTMADGKEFVARLVSHDPDSDLAIIKIDSKEPLPVTPIGTSRDLMTGETVIAIGNAFGYEHTITRGIISALHRTVQVGEDQKYEDLIQTDASINPGNSGGPLFNVDGEMIGINVAVRVGAQGIGFAIPIDRAMLIAGDLLSVRRLNNAWHGLLVEAEPPLHPGKVLVRGFDKESPASACGLEVGDRIKRVGEIDVARPLDLERALIGKRAGDEVELVVEHGQSEKTVKLTLAALPEHLRVTDDPAWRLLGVRLKPIPAKEFQRYQTRYRGGLSVVEVRPGSPAAKQGIRRGDVLVGMHVWETISLENVSYVLNRPDFAQLTPLKFYILRGSETYLGHMHVAGVHTR
jgi:serine protease Do